MFISWILLLGIYACGSDSQDNNKTEPEIPSTSKEKIIENTQELKTGIVHQKGMLLLN